KRQALRHRTRSERAVREEGQEVEEGRGEEVGRRSPVASTASFDLGFCPGRPTGPTWMPVCMVDLSRHPRSCGVTGWLTGEVDHASGSAGGTDQECGPFDEGSSGGGVFGWEVFLRC